MPTSESRVKYIKHSTYIPSKNNMSIARQNNDNEIDNCLDTIHVMIPDLRKNITSYQNTGKGLQYIDIKTHYTG